MYWQSPFKYCAMRITSNGILLEPNEIVHADFKIKMHNLPYGEYIFRNRPEDSVFNWFNAVKNGYVVLRESTKEEKTKWLLKRDGDYLPTPVIRKLVNYNPEIEQGPIV